MFEYGKAVLVRPVVHYFGEYEDEDVLLPCRLWCKKVVTFLFLRTPKMWALFQFQYGMAEAKCDEPWVRTRSDSSASGMFFFQYC